MKTASMEATSSVKTLIEKIEGGYAEIVRLYRSVPVTKIVEPTLPNGWSVKDLLGHLAVWEWRYASLLEASHYSDVPLQAEPDVDALNKEIYQERLDWGWEEIEHDARAAHRSLLNAIRQLPPERLEDDVVLKSIAAETWEHYNHHLADLRQWHRQITRGYYRRR